jgi:hypothetical protein
MVPRFVRGQNSMIRSGYSNGAGHSFAQEVGATSVEPLQYSFSLEREKSVRLEGLTVNLNKNGDIWGARYDNGEAVRRNAKYTTKRHHSFLLV